MYSFWQQSNLQIKYVWRKLEKSCELLLHKHVNQIVGVNIENREDSVFICHPHSTQTLLQDKGVLTSYAPTPMVAALQIETATMDSTEIETSICIPVIGTISYLAAGTQPDIAYTVNYLTWFSSSLQKDHPTALKHFPRYLSSTKPDWILFWDVKGKLEVFCDAYWGGEASILTHGYNVLLYGCPIGWASKCKFCVATSTCHAGYMVLGTAAR